MKGTSNNSSAGIGDPYWYEWELGLLKAVEMLNSDSDIESVCFQQEGIKGWDDVVVKLNSGRVEYYQVKHSRTDNNVTFSDLIGKPEEGASLLNSLSTSWHELGDRNLNAVFTILTNRAAGTNWSRDKKGNRYPPLCKFIKKLNDLSSTTSELTDINIPKEWRPAWEKWLNEINIPDDITKVRFLKSLKISVDAPERSEIDDDLSSLLSTSLGISPPESQQYLNNLYASVRTWATTLRGRDSWITPEHVAEALIEPKGNVLGLCNIPTPTPFFPSRLIDVKNLTDLLVNPGEHRIIFLEAEPGCGKTSVISKLINQRTEDIDSLPVNIRYFAYKPITPDEPNLSLDADDAASGTALWHTLLDQLRLKFKGRLLEFKVPLRNGFLSAELARNHVLRLAKILGTESQSTFTIVIDGIDHAARAIRKGLPSLLKSLPPPEMVPDNVRLLIAGQPADGYPEYPNWLRSSSKLVFRTSLGSLKSDDITTLITDCIHSLPEQEIEGATNHILKLSEGNTLSAVFAVAELEACDDLESFKKTLRDKQLHSGVIAYYQSIWESITSSKPPGLAIYLASALAILKERTTGTLLNNAFPSWEIATPEWDAILKSMEPLIMLDSEGYRIRHNDIRVFLEGELKQNQALYNSATSDLADYYLKPGSNPKYRYRSLFALLDASGRETEKAEIFDTDWVLNSVAYDKSTKLLRSEAKEAFSHIVDLKDWDVTLKMACGGLTLAKLEDCFESFDLLPKSIKVPDEISYCLESERFIPPLKAWDDTLLTNVFDDIKSLLKNLQTERASELYRSWFDKLTPSQLLSKIPSLTEKAHSSDEKKISEDAECIFETWGNTAFLTSSVHPSAEPKTANEHEAAFLFKKGWIIACVQNENVNSWTHLRDFNIGYIGILEIICEEAAILDKWALVRKALLLLEKEISQLNLEFRINAAYWSLKSNPAGLDAPWLAIIPKVKTLEIEGKKITLEQLPKIAKTLGWLEPHRDPSAISSELIGHYLSLNTYVQNERSLRIILHSCSMTGLIEGLLSKGKHVQAKDLVNLSKLTILIQKLWDYSRSIHSHDFSSYVYAEPLIIHGQKIGPDHATAILNIAKERAQSFPIDQTMQQVWTTLRSAGEIALLKQWLEHWIGVSGKIWKGESFSERAETVHKLSEMAYEEGWTDLADSAEQKLKQNLIGYSSHKDQSLEEAFDWIKELLLIHPKTWRNEGVELLNICQECSSQGGSNNLEQQIESSIAVAAFKTGPSDAWIYTNFYNPETNPQWIYFARNNILHAANNNISDKSIAVGSDILSLWASSIGVTRWFEKHHTEGITELRDSILASTVPTQNIESFLANISPSEFIREEYSNKNISEESHNNDAARTPSDIRTSVQTLTQKSQAGSKVSLIRIGVLAENIARLNLTDRGALLSTLFSLIDVNNSYQTSWDLWGQSHPLQKLMPLLRESEKWLLVHAALRGVEETYWTKPVSHNIQLICLFNAVPFGKDSLRAGAATLLDMHHRWSNSSQKEYKLFQYDSLDLSVISWPNFTTLLLLKLLKSNSAETKLSAIQGLHIQVEATPEIIKYIFDKEEVEHQSWLLHCAEVWATKHPTILEPILLKKWNSRESLTFLTQIQLWVCLNMLQLAKDGQYFNETFIPEKTTPPQDKDIAIPSLRLLDIPPKIHGATRLSNIYSAMQSTLLRLRCVTGKDTSTLESTIANYISSSDFITDTANVNMQFASEQGDMLISPNLDDTINYSLPIEMNDNNWSDRYATRIAQAVSHGEDPWITTTSPEPSPSTLKWPELNTVEEWLKGGAKDKDIYQQLQSLILGNDLDPNKRILGSCLKIFTSSYDFEMFFWLEENPSNRGNQALERPRTCSGRCNQFFMKNPYEPSVQPRKPLVFFSYSSLQLAFSTLEIIPSQYFRSITHLHPNLKNPLNWYEGEDLQMDYQRYHSPYDLSWNRRHMRQSTLTRWVCNAKKLTSIKASQHWEHESHDYNEEW